MPQKAISQSVNTVKVWSKSCELRFTLSTSEAGINKNDVQNKVYDFERNISNTAHIFGNVLVVTTDDEATINQIKTIFRNFK